MSESQKEQKLRKSKIYRFNAWDAVKNIQVPITFSDLTQISPIIRQQLRSGLTKKKPDYEIRRVNTTQTQSDDETRETKTSAYTMCQIEDCVVEAIIDTGAGICLISKPMLERLGWSIEEPTKMRMIVADGTKAIPLGKVKDVPVRFGNCTIPTSMMVTESTTYDLILGNEWLTKAQAVIDLNAKTMRITWKGVTLGGIQRSLEAKR